MAKDRLIRKYPAFCNRCNAAMPPGRKSFICHACQVSPENRKRRKEYMRQYRERPVFKRYLRTYLRRPDVMKRKRKQCADRPQYYRDYQQAVRAEVLKHYGNRCACCGESHKEFLSIDHINGDGAKHRREIKQPIDRWLKSHNYPPGFRVLCMNCNFSLGKRGYCPHGTLPPLHTT